MGAFLLWLPFSQNDSQHTSLVDAFFTATSALCVVGLVTLDTAEHWSLIGQIIIALLVQIGGLGVMVIATIIARTVLGKLSMRARINVAAETKSNTIADLGKVIFIVLKISLVIETVLAFILFLRFWLGYGESIPKALWQGIFHAITTFNNAGFSLFSSSMSEYIADPFIALPMSAAVIIGGLGFPVLVQLRQHGFKHRKWNLNTRLVVSATAALLFISTIWITVLEWGNPATYGTYNIPTRILGGFFQAVQTRTAGFSNVDVGNMDESTLLGIDVFMFIGTGPAGTGGGIKVTTFSILLLVLIAEIRASRDVNAFWRRIPRTVVREAISVALLAIGAIITSTVILQTTTDFTTYQTLFESVSAFSTTGLSTGITGDLSDPAKITLTILMLFGRIGPMAFASALALQIRNARYRFPSERPIIG